MISPINGRGGKPMSENDRLALNARFQLVWKERASTYSESDYFAFFAAEQVLKDFYPTDDDILAGQVGGENDGGVDGIYFLVNRQFVSDDTVINSKVSAKADLVIIQATIEQSFNEKRVKNLNLLTEDMLTLSKDQHALGGHYNADVLAIMSRFKTKYRMLLGASPSLTISYYYISKGDKGTVNAGLDNERKRVIAKAEGQFSGASVKFDFVGAAELLSLVNKQPPKTLPLVLAESPMSSKTQKAWICLVPIVEYYKFMSDDKGEIRNELFEANIRDWQGLNVVNTAIQDSLANKSASKFEDFWWLNNGITILSSNAPNEGGFINVESPLIVNGLQTSRCIFNYVSTLSNADQEKRNVLVRIIVPEQPDTRDHIIRATNSQTPVPAFHLHMTENIHRDIEALLLSHDLFYDRRRNYYKNENKPIVKIVEPLTLAQTIMSVLLQRPSDARARPTTVLKDEYKKVFNKRYPLVLYATCAMLTKKIEQFLVARSSSIPRNTRTNLRWYLAMEYARSLTETDSPKYATISAISIPSDDALLEVCYKKVADEYESLGGTDQIAKGPNLTIKLKKTPYASV